MVIKPTGEELPLSAFPTEPEVDVDGIFSRTVVNQGDILRVNLHLCTTTTTEATDGFQGRISFAAGQGTVDSDNSRWYTEDRIDLRANVPVRLSTFFQAVPAEENVLFHLIPWIKWGEGAGTHFVPKLNILRFRVGSTSDGEPVHTKGPTGAKNCSSSQSVGLTSSDQIHVEVANMHKNPGDGDPDSGEGVRNYHNQPPGTVLVGSVRACTTVIGGFDAHTVRLAVKLVPLATGVGSDLQIPPGLTAPTNPLIVDTTAALIIAPWEDAPFNRNDVTVHKGDSDRNTLFYQWVPDVPGVYALVPRVMGLVPPEENSDIGPGPDDSVLAEGSMEGNPNTDDVFVFCVQQTECTLPPSGDGS